MSVDGTFIPFAIGDTIYYLDTEVPRNPVLHQEVIKSIEIYEVIESNTPDEEDTYKYLLRFMSGRWAYPSEVTYIPEKVTSIIPQDFATFEKIFNISPEESKRLFNTETPCTK